MDKIYEKPSVNKIDMECIKCKNKSHVYFTGEEIRNKSMIQQWCSNCKRIENYQQSFEV